MEIFIVIIHIGKLIVIQEFFLLQREKGILQVPLTRNHLNMSLVNILEKFQPLIFATKL